MNIMNGIVFVFNLLDPRLNAYPLAIKNYRLYV